jgi:hypothetical protein
VIEALKAASGGNEEILAAIEVNRVEDQKGKEELSDDAAAPLASSSALDDAVVFEVTFRNDGVSPQEVKSSQGAEFDLLFA